MASQAAALVKGATDLVGLIGEVTEVRGTGAAAKALCPFHADRDTPSLSVSADKGVWHCFGCGLGGDALDFVQQSQAVGFRESLDVLARRAGVDLGRCRFGEPGRGGSTGSAGRRLGSATRCSEATRRRPEPGRICVALTATRAATWLVWGSAGHP